MKRAKYVLLAITVGALNVLWAMEPEKTQKSQKPKPRFGIIPEGGVPRQIYFYPPEERLSRLEQELEKLPTEKRAEFKKKFYEAHGAVTKRRGVGGKNVPELTTTGIFTPAKLEQYLAKERTAKPSSEETMKQVELEIQVEEVFAGLPDAIANVDNTWADIKTIYPEVLKPSGVTKRDDLLEINDLLTKSEDELSDYIEKLKGRIRTQTTQRLLAPTREKQHLADLRMQALQNAHKTAEQKFDEIQAHKEEILTMLSQMGQSGSISGSAGSESSGGG